MWQDSQKCRHFYKSCEGTLSPSILNSSHSLDFMTFEVNSTVIKQRLLPLETARGISIAPHYKCALLHICNSPFIKKITYHFKAFGFSISTLFFLFTQNFFALLIATKFCVNLREKLKRRFSPNLFLLSKINL